jgi:uncharacterized protein YprB with RNaseH-like and TPR domain
MENMNKYYFFRKQLHELYNNSDSSVGDLCCKLLAIRDKNRIIDSMEIELDNFTVTLEFNTEATKEEIKNITIKVANTIGRYIIDNRKHLPISVNIDPEFDSFMNSDNMLFCDIITVGNIVKINL